MKKNILIFPAGTEIGLEIHSSLKENKSINIFGAGIDTPNHGKFIFTNYHIVPNIADSSWLNELLKLCNKLNIDYIFPAYDDVLIALMEKKDLIPHKIIGPSLDICKITRSKKTTYNEFEKTLTTPKIYNSPEEVDAFPVFIKPDKGQGSFQCIKINNENELLDSIKKINQPIICEYLPGEEYTVDCFSDRDQGLIFSRARTRSRIRNGIAVNSHSIDLEEATPIAHKIYEQLKINGAWFFQLKRNSKGVLTLLEIAPRIAGSMATHRVQGINFPLLSIYEAERIPLKIITNKNKIEIDRALSNRYRHDIKYKYIYIDLDDTIIINEKLNLSAIHLIFKSLNDGIKIILITRHRSDLSSTLKKFRIDNLFHEIIHINDNSPKSLYINKDQSIFIDDSFSEREEVFLSKGIPTFDCSMIEILTNS